MKIGFIGAGKVGTTFGKYLRAREEGNLMVTGYYSRTPESAETAAEFTGTKAYGSAREVIEASDVIFLTVPDRSIRPVWEQIRKGLPAKELKGKFICHTSGSMSTREAFPHSKETGVHVYSVHPMIAVSSRTESWKELDTAFFTLEGDKSHIEDAASIMTDLDLKFTIVSSENKKLYHCASVVSSNLANALIQTGIDMLKQCGFTGEDALAALQPLAVGNMEHIFQAGPSASLTGPVERGDATTVAAHLDSIPDEEDRELYRILSRKAEKLAAAKHPDRDYSPVLRVLDASEALDRGGADGIPIDGDLIAVMREES